MNLDPEALYRQLRHLVATMPDLAGPGPITPEMNQWLGKAAALVEVSRDLPGLARLTVASQSLNSTLRQGNAQAIAVVVYAALARAELNAPASAQGEFIAAGDTLNAFAAVAKVLARAKHDLLLVDAYADQAIITDFVVAAPEGVRVRIMAADKEARKQALRPAVQRWGQQYGNARPLSVRVVPGANMHDRLILVDSAEAWSLGQSFNAMAARAHTSIVKSDDELAAMKVAAYEALWSNGKDL